MMQSLLSAVAALLPIVPLFAAQEPVKEAAQQPAQAPVPQELRVESSAEPISPDVWTTVGAQIPDVELARVDGGGLVSLASFRGKRLLLIHFASW